MKLFFVVLLGAGVTMVSALQGCHHDLDPDHRVRLSCTAVGFNTVPTGVQPMTELNLSLCQVLLFPSNQFTSLSWESFQIFSKLHELDLTANQVGQVTPRAEPLLPHLSVLRLGRNRLTSLPDRAFSACPALTHLYLDNNAIESLSDDTFAGLSKLEILDLSSNHIRVLPPLLLRPLVGIETLYLESNQISELSDNWFSPREEVPYLYLSANPWACFCELMYLNTYIKDYFFNFYVRDDTTISRDPKSVVCHSPQWSKGRAILDLNLDDLCLPPTLQQTIATPLPFQYNLRVTEWQKQSKGNGSDDVWQLTTSGASDRFSTTTTASHPSTSTPLPATLSVATPASSEVLDKRDGAPRSHVPGAGVFCVWLLVSNVCLCVVMAASTVVTLVKLVVWYRGASDMQTQKTPKKKSITRKSGGIPRAHSNNFF
ncbi:phospholipase A2 inhibitor beta-like [Phycodurus eques]|uniref:phospholipase A2 inhibitor beta-like n=1 Tax=Phycodurus eques TaxID=693459 RepID=UPI002ACE9856|nr:phospholipase A2 inhibitor beta-like [Phycodurus eques]